VLNYRLVQYEGATAAATVNFLVPVVAVTLGVVVLAEPMTWNLLVGAVIVLILGCHRSPPASADRGENSVSTFSARQ